MHGEAAIAALSDVDFDCYWLSDPSAPAANAALTGKVKCDLAIVGGGYTGLWTALLAKERNPDVDVVLLEANTIAWAASGRNGGFCDSSLTHGLVNGLDRFADELPRLESLGHENFNELEETLKRYEIDCEYERNGAIDIATAEWQLEGLRELSQEAPLYGHEVELLDGAALRAEVDSPTYLGGLWHKDSVALIHPTKLAWGLKAVCERLGVRIYERSAVTSLDTDSGGISLDTHYGKVIARRVALGTNAFRPLLRRLQHYIAPVFDYALMTEPLSKAQLSSIGWKRRQGLADSANQFHYYRLTSDNRILWGGYDAIYYFNNSTSLDHEHRRETYLTLARNFFTTFPQLEGLRFSHAWGGVIDTCSRFSQFWGTANGGQVAYCLGYTGLGVAATRFGAQVMLDLLEDVETERTQLEMVRSKPVPFPPEPLRWSVIQLTRWSLASADRNEGNRNVWLRALDRVGLGFNS